MGSTFFTIVFAGSSLLETLMNNLHNSTGTWLSHCKWDFISLVLYKIYTKCFSITKAGAGWYDLAISPA